MSAFYILYVQNEDNKDKIVPLEAAEKSGTMIASSKKINKTEAAFDFCIFTSLELDSGGLTITIF